jgi:N-acetylmuramoyl-L-alanine amidase
MKILLIAGHGESDPGAVGNGYKEADVAREVVKLIQKELNKYASTYVADINKNWYRYVIKNRNRLNYTAYDYVLEVHFNSGAGDLKGNGTTTGTEIFVTREEKAVAVEENIVRNIAKLGFKNRGVKRKNFDLINYVKKQGVSSALLEVCFIDDKDDMKLYTAKKQAIAQAVAKGIAEGFALTEQGADDLTKADVIAIIKEYETEKAKEPAGTWSEKSVAKAKAKGIMDGTAPKSPATREQIAVILDRLNLL